MHNFTELRKKEEELFDPDIPAWQNDPGWSRFWFNEWLAQFDASFDDLPIWAECVDASVHRELGRGYDTTCRSTSKVVESA